MSLPEPTPPSPRPRRRTQEERREETKRRLLEAAYDLLIERGYAGLTTAEVSRRAGLSRGAQSHHYPSKNALVAAATEYVYDKALARGLKIAGELRGSTDPVGDFIRYLRSVYFGPAFHAALELVVAARTDPDLMRHVRTVLLRYHEEVHRAWRDAFEAAGISPQKAETILGLTLDMVRGMGINAMWRQDWERYDRLLDEWLRLMEGLRRA